MILLLEILAVLCMLTLMFIGIWSFVILNKLFGQMRYRNYLLEKINHTISMLNYKELPISDESAAKTELDSATVEEETCCLESEHEHINEYIE